MRHHSEDSHWAEFYQQLQESISLLENQTLLVLSTDQQEIQIQIKSSGYEDNDSPYMNRIKEMHPEIFQGQTIYSGEVWIQGKNSGTYHLPETLTLTDAIEHLRKFLERYQIPVPESQLNSLRPRLSYGASLDWLKQQPGFDKNKYDDADRFRQKLHIVKDMVQGQISGKISPEKLRELRRELQELDEYLLVPGVEPADPSKAPDLADTILDLWHQYKKNPSTELRKQIEVLRNKL